MIVGIIAEYNPFHKGHLYQIEYAKQVLKADAVVVAMSGDFTQRGTPALLSKYQRTSMAILNGADIVFEIPSFFATSSAEHFAKSGVSLLSHTSIVDTLLFGCETPNIPLFQQIADILLEEPPKFKEKLQYYLKQGFSFPKARDYALQSMEIPTEPLQHPNNLLAIEYIKALKWCSSKITPIGMQREESNYHDTCLSQNYSSATAIRKFISHEPSSIETLKNALPEASYEILLQNIKQKEYVLPDDVSLLLHQCLYQKDDFSMYADCSDELSQRIRKNRDNYDNFTDFCMRLKSKDITLSRISRVLSHILLEQKKDDFISFQQNNYAHYLRLLGFSKQGSHYLNDIKTNSQLPCISNVSQGCKLLSQPQQQLLQKDYYASEVYRMLLTNNTSCWRPGELTRKFKPIP